MLKKEFVLYEEALALKELGFDGGCFGWYDGSDISSINLNYSKNSEEWLMNSIHCTAPLYQQAFGWFRENCGLRSAIIPYWIGNTYMVVIEGKMIGEIKPDLFDTYEEAELACLKKLIEIVKEKL